ncbi:hypothetical protein B0H11DRAFT_2053876 [Mycena galericulata]|nr:hypothetical protein B0H11DRAFT_2053876 [Mycena galericulata]
MAPRTGLPPKKNRARCGIKYALKIVKGDLVGPEDSMDEDLDETQSLMVGDVDIHEGQEHHLLAALATRAAHGSEQAAIPTPGIIDLVHNYHELYPTNKWQDPVSYLQTTQTVEEACANAFADYEYTYFMDEDDKRWLDKNNQEARGEGTSASSVLHSSHKGKEKEPEIGVPVSITEDEFELVMGLFEKITDPKAVEGDFSLYQHFFLEPLPPNIFASYTSPTWIPAPAFFVRIARTVFPHWKHRRSLVKGRRIRPSLNYDESDFLNESYICFRRRDNKPVRKTRSGQVVHSDRLAQLDKNLAQALDIANVLLKRETIKQASAVHSQRVWNARKPLADLIRTFPTLCSKADESLLVEKTKKVKPARSSLPKVKVLPPGNSGSSAGAILPSQRSADIQQKIIDKMNADSVRNQHQVDVVDDPYQPPLLSRPESLWVDVLPSITPSVRSGSPALRLRYGRGGRRFLDRRSGSHPLFSPLRNHRQHLNDELDEETTRHLQAQWHFDADDCAAFGLVDEQDRELVDEYDSRYLVARMAWGTNEEASLIPDAHLIHRERTVLPFVKSAESAADTSDRTLAAYTTATLVLRAGATAGQQKPSQASSVLPPRIAQAVSTEARIPATHGQPPRMQENISPPPGPVLGTYPASPSPHPQTRAPLPRPHATSNPNPIVVAPPIDTVKAVGHPNHIQNRSPDQSHNLVQAPPRPPAHPLQTNGARTSVPAYVPLNAGTNMSLRLPQRVPRPSPLSTCSVVATDNTSPHTSSRLGES